MSEMHYMKQEPSIQDVATNKKRTFFKTEHAKLSHLKIIRYRLHNLKHFNNSATQIYHLENVGCLHPVIALIFLQPKY
jgi:hypothetical protein